MSTEAAVVEKIEEKKSEPLFFEEEQKTNFQSAGYG